jgi:hypothetical protein
MTNKILFDTNPCSSSSEGSPPLSNDFLLTRSNPATTLNLTQFNYIQQNHHHHPSSNGFIPRDDWSQIPMAQTTNSPVWAKGKEMLFFDSLMPSYCIKRKRRRRRRRLLNTSYT